MADSDASESLMLCALDHESPAAALGVCGEMALLHVGDVHTEHQSVCGKDGWASSLYGYFDLGKSGRENRRIFDEWAAELCAPGFHRLDLADAEQSGGVSVERIELGGGRISADAMSEGDWCCLGIIATLLFAKPSSIVCFDAPTAGLHPARISRLVQLFDEVSQELEIQLIVTTHDASLLRWLDDGARGDDRHAVVEDGAVAARWPFEITWHRKTQRPSS